MGEGEDAQASSTNRRGMNCFPASGKEGLSYFVFEVWVLINALLRSSGHFGSAEGYFEKASGSNPADLEERRKETLLPLKASLSATPSC